MATITITEKELGDNLRKFIQSSRGHKICRIIYSGNFNDEQMMALVKEITFRPFWVRYIGPLDNIGFDHGKFYQVQQELNHNYQFTENRNWMPPSYFVRAEAYYPYPPRESELVDPDEVYYGMLTPGKKYRIRRLDQTAKRKFQYEVIDDNGNTQLILSRFFKDPPILGQLELDEDEDMK